MLAKDLDQAYINFDPTRPLRSVSKFYVKRKRNPLDVMKRSLMRENVDPPKFLFSGHRGSGKSTELNRLVAYSDMQEKYFIVYYSVREVLDVAGLEYTDLLFSIGAQIFIEAANRKVELRKKLLDELSKWRSVIEEETERGRKVGVEAGLDVPLTDFFSNGQLKLKLEYESRKKMRSKIESRLSELINIINLIIAEVELNSSKKVLVAIEDLDKPDLKVAEELFCRRQSSLIQPRCAIIYTIPIALLYSSQARQVTQNFSKSYVLPNISITKHKDRRCPNEQGQATMREFAAKRMSLELINKDALGHAITISGGVFREMARIIRDAADNAIARGEKKIGKRDVEEAESEIRNEFRRMLQTKDYEQLRKIYQTRELRGSEIFADLMHNLSILEYQNDKAWCDVHPAIIPLIEGRES